MSGNDRDDRQAEYLHNRLKKNDRILRKWARTHDIHAMRLYDRDIPEIPLAIDRYCGSDGCFLVMALYERPYEKDEDSERIWLLKMAKAAATALDLPESNVHFKTRRKMRGLDQYTKVESGHSGMVVEEGGLKFIVNLSDYLDTGLFLDHRTTRMLVRSLARGKSMLNLFSYTGIFSVYAAAGGAMRIQSVDLSNTYLTWARANFNLNALLSPSYTFLRSDVTAFLREERNRNGKWDIIVVDPPTFSNSSMAETDFDVNKHWPSLLNSCAALLSPDGIIIFSTNSRTLVWDASIVGMPTKDFSRFTVPKDFRNAKIHRCWVLGQEEIIALAQKSIEGDALAL
jgi:23S rRNA (cytosine1962-C5)-methyltransferase